MPEGGRGQGNKPSGGRGHRGPGRGHKDPDQGHKGSSRGHKDSGDGQKGPNRGHQGPSKNNHHGGRPSTSASAPTPVKKGTAFSLMVTRDDVTNSVAGTFDFTVTTKFHCNFTILVDRSGSMASDAGGGKTRMEVAHEAFEMFVNEVAERREEELSDLICVWTFNHDARHALVGSADRFNLKHHGLQGDFAPAGGTDLPRAMQKAIAWMEEYNDKVKRDHHNAVVQWLVVFTDGDTNSSRLTQDQTVAMLREASHSIWNFKVCFIGIGQSASETAVLQGMAAAVKDRLGTPGGMVCATRGTDILSMRKVFKEASTVVRQIQDKLVFVNGDVKHTFEGDAARPALEAMLSGLSQLALGGGGKGGKGGKGGSKKLLTAK